MSNTNNTPSNEEISSRLAALDASGPPQWLMRLAAFTRPLDPYMFPFFLFLVMVFSWSMTSLAQKRFQSAINAAATAALAAHHHSLQATTCPEVPNAEQ